MSVYLEWKWLRRTPLNIIIYFRSSQTRVLMASTINNMTYVSVRVYRSEAIWPPRYNWNIVKSGVKHHNPNTPIQQTVIYLVPMMPDPRITLFPYSNTQDNLTIICYATNVKNWNSDLYWKVVSNNCNKYGELYCWHYSFCCYFDEQTQILPLFLIYFSHV